MNDSLKHEERALMGKREDKTREKHGSQPLTRPDLPTLDELGFETVEFKCWRCARTDLREKNMAEAIQRGGHKLFCMACDRPDLFEWDAEKLADGTIREFIRPLSAREVYKQLSPEAHALAAKQALVQCLRVRRDAILRETAKLEEEFMSLMPAIEIAEQDVIEAQRLVSAMEHDQVSQKMASLEKLNADVERLKAEIAAAEKANQAGTSNFKDDVMRRIKDEEGGQR